jgi:serine/threonine protein kinase
VPIAPGETFERYAVESLIGRGGMGEVYRATDTRLRRKVALKVLRHDKERPDAVARLFREARAAAALSHPNTIAIHDLGESDDGTFYIVMELVTGSPLLAFVGDERVPLSRKLEWLSSVAKALAAAHKAGVLHRDVKPSNVMVGEDDVVKVLDFGLAKPSDPVSFKTQVGRVLGTPRYMAPELLSGAEADARSDQFSFGVTAYELVAGKHPGAAPDPLSAVVKDAPKDLVAIIAKTMAARPDDRYPTMDDVALALDDVRAGRRPRIGGIAVFAATVKDSANMAASKPLDTVRDDALHDKIIAQEQADPTVSLPIEAPPALAERMAAHARAHDPLRTLLSKEAPTGVQVARAAAVAFASPPSPAMAPPAKTMPSANPPAIPRPAALPSGPPAATVTPPEPSRPPWVAVGIASILALGAGGFGGMYYAKRLEAQPVSPPATVTVTASATATATVSAITTTTPTTIATDLESATPPTTSSAPRPLPTGSHARPRTTARPATTPTPAPTSADTSH